MSAENLVTEIAECGHMARTGVCTPCYNASLTVLAKAMIYVAEAERLVDGLDNERDRGYQNAVSDIVIALRNVARERGIGIEQGDTSE